MNEGVDVVFVVGMEGASKMVIRRFRQKNRRKVVFLVVGRAHSLFRFEFRMFYVVCAMGFNQRKKRDFNVAFEVDVLIRLDLENQV